MNKSKIYLASDFHLGLNFHLYSSEHREKIIVKWLDEIKTECAELYLVGDVFDYWFEYNEVIPKGNTRLLGKLCELADSGTKIHLFTGNHDMWMFHYFQKEIGLELHKKPITAEFFGKKYFIAHGDGLGPNDHVYKVIKKVFSNKTMQWCFHRIHPNLGIRMMKFFSFGGRSDKDIIMKIDDVEKEWLTIFSKEYIQKNTIDFFIYGHRHFPLIYNLSPHTKMIYLGDWISHFTYVCIDENQTQLCKYQTEVD